MTDKTHFDIRAFTCKNCAFHDVLTDVQSRQQTGICRRRPPTTFAQAIPVPSGPNGGVGINWSYSTMWTMVKDGDWCGEHSHTRGDS